jgi:two-component system, chemotaxis family, CheB/CheR fusion protein
LGLPIARRLALLLGHNLDVGSILGRGSVFAIEVPLRRSSCSDRTTQRCSPRPTMVERPSVDILVIDDDPEVRGLLELVLRSKGHRVTAVGDAVQALESLNAEDRTLDLVIADYNLPGSLNGLEITTLVRRACRHELPAIILTGDISKQTSIAIDRNGCVRLTKPVKVEELERRIALVLFDVPETTLQSAVNSSDIGCNIRGSVFVIDDEVSVREPMRELLEAKGWVAETYATCEAFLQADHPGRKGCVLVDARLPGMDGLDLVKQLNPQRHRLPTIMVTGYGDIRMAVDAIAAGALDFIEKPADYEKLHRSIRRAFEVMEGSSKLIASKATAAARAATLTARQRQIMTLVLAGQPSKNIAVDLGIGQRTVENHRAAIMKKMGVSSLPQLVRVGIAALGQDEHAPSA